MQSSAGSHSPPFRPRVLLAAVALAALAASLLLAFVSTTAARPHARRDGARVATAATPIAAPATPPAASTFPADAENPNGVGAAPSLSALLTPWAFAVDAIAVAGLAAILIVRYKMRRRRGARI